VAGKDFEQEREYGCDLRDDRIVVGLDGMIPSLGQILQEDMILLITSFPFLCIEIFAQDGSLAGQIEVFGRVEEGIEESFEQV
jgi:hypothetical protein